MREKARDSRVPSDTFFSSVLPSVSGHGSFVHAICLALIVFSGEWVSTTAAGTTAQQTPAVSGAVPSRFFDDPRSAGHHLPPITSRENETAARTAELEHFESGSEESEQPASTHKAGTETYFVGGVIGRASRLDGGSLTNEDQAETSNDGSEVTPDPKSVSHVFSPIS